MGSRTARHRASAGLRSFIAAIVLFLAATASSLVHAQPPTGREIMERVDNRDDGDDGVMDLEMTLIDRRGHTRHRRLRYYFKDHGEDTYRLMFFLEPADVKDTAFLTYDYRRGRDDDQWLYLPALRKTKRIASSDQSGSFVGSDLSYADLSKRDLDRYDYRLLKEAEVDGHKVWVVEAIPRTEKEIEETGTTKTIYFVRQDNDVVIRSVSWLKKGHKLKYMQVDKLERIDGIWVPTDLRVWTKRGDRVLHRTRLRSLHVRFNQKLPDELFTTRRLEKGA